MRCLIYTSSRFLGVAVLASVVLTVLYNTNEFVSTFLNRFVGDDIMTGRDTIYETLMADFGESNFLIGRGTSATYELAEEGAQDVYKRQFPICGEDTIELERIAVSSEILGLLHAIGISVLFERMPITYYIVGVTV